MGADKIPAIDHQQPVGPATLANDSLSFQFQVGSAKFPDNPCEGLAEAYYRLQQAAGVALHNHDDMSITPAKFMGNEAVFGVDFERCGNEATMTGISTRDGKTMTLTVKGSQVTSAAPHTLYVFQVYDGIANIRRAAVDIEE